MSNLVDFLTNFLNTTMFLCQLIKTIILNVAHWIQCSYKGIIRVAIKEEINVINTGVLSLWNIIAMMLKNEIVWQTVQYYFCLITRHVG